MKNITMTPWKSSYYLNMTFSSSTNTLDQFRLRRLEEESDNERIRLEEMKNEKVEPAGGACVLPEAGKTSAHP